MATKVYGIGMGSGGVKSFPLDVINEWGDWGASWTANGSTRNPEQLINYVGYLFRAVELRANAVSVVPWSIYRAGSDTAVWESEEPEPPEALATLADMPEILYRVEASLTLMARAYLYKERNRVRMTGLRWLDPTTMTPKWEPSGLVGFERNANGGMSRLAVDDVVYLWYRGLSETEPRTSPAQAASNAANVLYNTAEFAKAFFARGALKATLLTVEGIPLPAEREKLKTIWQRMYSGVKNAFAVDVMSAAVKPVVVGEGIQELSNVALTVEQREDIATAMGVPHSLVMSNASNFATAQQDAKNFYETTIIPECRVIERQLNAQLFAPLGYRFTYRPQSLDVFQEDENQRSAAFAAYVSAGVKPSIVAQMLGLELPEGIDYEDLDPEPTELAEPPQDAPAASEREEDEREVEAKRFRAWARKRRNADPSAFKSDILTLEEREALLGEMGGRFPAAWSDYP